MPYQRLHYHLIWATYRRQPWLVDAVERQVYGTILNKAKELGCIIHAIGGIEDHIHIAVTIPAKLAVADVVSQFKGASSYYVNHQSDPKGSFRWQSGYGALTFGDQAMKTIVAYIDNQKDHHRQNSTIGRYERSEAED